MTNKQEQLCSTITRLTKEYPHLRVMQLISNAVPQEVHKMLNNDLYYIEDEALLDYLLVYEHDIRRHDGEGSH